MEFVGDGKKSRQARHMQRLYDDAARRRKRLESERAELSKREGCTFKPSLKARTGKTAAGKSATSISGSRFEKLFRDGAAKKKKLDNEKKRVDPECSFKPKTNNRRRKNNSNAQKKASPGERLYESAVRKAKEHQELRNASPEGCTFHPKTNEGVITSPGRSPTRLCPSRAEQAAKRHNNEAQKVANELLECTFQPQKKNKDPKKTAARLFRFAERAKRKLDEKREREIVKELEECTFQPRINEASKAWEKQRDSSSEDFAVRLFRDSEAKGRRLEELKLAYMEAEMHVPNGRDTKYNPHRLDELHHMGTEKVAMVLKQEKDPNRQHSLVALKEIEDLRECTFQPNAYRHHSDEEDQEEYVVHDEEAEMVAY